MSECILIVGSGAREHAIAVALARSPQQPEVLCFGSARNPGIAALASAYTTGKTTDAVAVARFAVEHQATIAIVGPEDPLAAGVADALWSAGVPNVGPTASLARLESSKGFTRSLLDTAGIDANPAFERFTSMDGVQEWLDRFPAAHVIKDDGLAGGKGVKVYGDHLHSLEESLAYCEELTAAGRPFVLEEKLIGQEFSLLSFSDGTTLRHMPAVQDHKRAYNNDEGPNTGGMGTYTDADGSLPFLEPNDIALAQSINERTIAALREQCGEPYRGILYGGFIATATGVRLIEYNARFGDPESLNLLTLLESDFVAICRGIADEKLDSVEVKFNAQASVCKYIVPEGYPEAPRKGDDVVLPSGLPSAVTTYLGAVDEKDGQLVATGSRTVGFVAVGSTIAEAEALCQQACDAVSGPFFFRSDIATKPALDLRIRMMKELRAR
ncbi:phosphoribosylamine--glycine ligase [Granulicella cerasi]|uniref:Phosphoribosylamine--glycine ligase n=1 Tax=Granulicella cerasi TaxID=741063 RepID=A0ABW1Z4S3_9BACT|nr:phosphoribosylamine--glycine ligase [Granulicella cerasi]